MMPKSDDTANTVLDHEPYAYASLQRGPAEIMLLALADYRKPDLRPRRPSGLWDAQTRLLRCDRGATGNIGNKVNREHG
jgi:hypothetical protein